MAAAREEIGTLQAYGASVSVAKKKIHLPCELRKHQYEKSCMVAKEDCKTYMDGPDIELHEQLTKDGMVRLCRSLETRFGDGNVFKPDAVGGGFIHWASWPGKTEGDEAYKCIRQCPRDSDNEWPWVERDAMTSWVGNQEVALEPGRYDTFLKAFYAAPAWTADEMRVVRRCLADVGINVIQTAAVTKKRTRESA
jgi:hypothetical protein